MLDAGTQAPDFTARNVGGEEIKLSQSRGDWVLVYFYPKDETPGCTAEACALNDHLDDFADCGAKVVGVSSQDNQSHEKFRQRHGLKFALAADTDHSIAHAYGVGKMAGIIPLHSRVSFLVDPDGLIAQVWPHVSPKRHAEEVLNAIKERQTATASS